MKKTKTIWLVLLAAAVLVCCQTPVPPYATTARIKVENDGGIIIGHNQSAATAMPYDPYYIYVNDIPHIPLSDAELFALASQPDNSPNRHPNR